MKLRTMLLASSLLPLSLLGQQPKDGVKVITLEEINITGIKTVGGTGHMPEVKDGIIYAGEKK